MPELDFFWHQNDLPCGGPRPPPTGYMKLQRKEKSFNFEETFFKTAVTC